MSGQTSLAQRVYEAVPMLEPWHRTKVLAEFSRLSGTTPHAQAVYACLGDLTEAGVIKERASNTYARVAVRESERANQCDQHEESKEEMTQNTSKPAPALGNAAFTALAGIATKLRALADEVESAALDADAALQQAGTESKKLAELRSLLQSI